MDLSRTIASMAVVLGVVLAAGFAVGEDRTVADKKALDEQQKRKEHFERACNKPLRTDNEKQMCRAAYRALNG
jgi:hypothetical protein